MSHLGQDFLSPRRAVLWERGRPIDLGTLPGDLQSEAAAINYRGQIVGSSSDQNGNSRPFLWKDGVMTELPDLGGGI